MTYWLLNSAVIAVGGDGDYNYRTIDKSAAIAWLRSYSFVSRIGYPDNQRFIEKISGVRIELSREESLMQAGDEALVVRPAYRLQSGSQKGQFRPNDSDFVFGILRRSS
jgi:hypothetical protein